MLDNIDIMFLEIKFGFGRKSKRNYKIHAGENILPKPNLMFDKNCYQIMVNKLP